MVLLDAAVLPLLLFTVRYIAASIAAATAATAVYHSIVFFSLSIHIVWCALDFELLYYVYRSFISIEVLMFTQKKK